MRILIAPCVAGLSLSAAVLRELLERSPEYFGEPIPKAEFPRLPPDTGSHGELYPGGLLKGDMLYFVREDLLALRTDSRLLEQFDKRGANGLVFQKSAKLKVVTIPADVHWHIFNNASGATHRHSFRTIRTCWLLSSYLPSKSSKSSEWLPAIQISLCISLLVLIFVAY